MKNAIEYKVRLNAPEIDAKHRHSTILATFDQLKAGEFLELTNNHDPRPLRYQFMMERDGLFSWEYKKEGPETWKVAIGKL